MVEEGLVNIQFISPLFKADAIDLFDLKRRGDIGGVDLNDIVAALFLLPENRKRLF